MIVWVGMEFGFVFFGAGLYGVWVATMALYIYHTARDMHYPLVSISRFGLLPLLFRFCETAYLIADLTSFVSIRWLSCYLSKRFQGNNQQFKRKEKGEYHVYEQFKEANKNLPPRQERHFKYSCQESAFFLVRSDPQWVRPSATSPGAISCAVSRACDSRQKVANTQSCSGAHTPLLAGFRDLRYHIYMCAHCTTLSPFRFCSS